MGPNGSGKSSLAATIMGHPKYQITNGSIILNDQEITELSVDKRARAGLFLAFQYPLAIPGVQVLNFLKEARRSQGDQNIDLIQFKDEVLSALGAVNLDASFATRYLNDGFSGGEKKRLEIVQLMVLKPRIVLLDEVDSGLDTDGIKQVAEILNKIRQQNPWMIFIIITHYPRMLKFIEPDFVHIMRSGRLITSGDKSLIETVDVKGYREFSI